jgi:hypothetical protein
MKPLKFVDKFDKFVDILDKHADILDKYIYNMDIYADSGKNISHEINILDKYIYNMDIYADLGKNISHEINIKILSWITSTLPTLIADLGVALVLVPALLTVPALLAVAPVAPCLSSLPVLPNLSSQPYLPRLSVLPPPAKLSLNEHLDLMQPLFNVHSLQFKIITGIFVLCLLGLIVKVIKFIFKILKNLYIKKVL